MGCSPYAVVVPHSNGRTPIGYIPMATYQINGYVAHNIPIDLVLAKDQFFAAFELLQIGAHFYKLCVL